MYYSLKKYAYNIHKYLPMVQEKWSYLVCELIIIHCQAFFTCFKQVFDIF